MGLLTSVLVEEVVLLHGPEGQLTVLYIAIDVVLRAQQHRLGQVACLFGVYTTGKNSCNKHW